MPSSLSAKLSSLAVQSKHVRPTDTVSEQPDAVRQAISNDQAAPAQLREQNMDDSASACQDHSGSKASDTTSAAAAFQSSIEAAAEQLRTTGWAVIDGVLDSAECEGYVEGVWRWLGDLNGGISREDPSRWHEAWPPTFKGIINTLEVAHQDFVWRIRKHPKILQVFSALYGTNELLSSFDSINVARPGVNDGEGWLHVDQAPLRRGMYCIQGLVNMVDVGPDTTGTLMVKDKSHLEHAPFFEHHTCLTREQQEKPADFYMFQKEELPYWEAFQSLALSGKAGSLFLWDSRTAHQNVLPKLGESWRHVCYVCYQPRSFATPKDLELKQQAYSNYRVTTHWPARNVALFPALGAEYFNDDANDTTATASSSDAAVADSIASAGAAGSSDGTESTSGAANGAANGAAYGTEIGADSGAAADGAADAEDKTAMRKAMKTIKQATMDYWGGRFADGSAQKVLQSIRTRDAVEDRLLLQLAAVQEYEQHEVVRTEPLLEVQC